MGPLEPEPQPPKITRPATRICDEQIMSTSNSLILSLYDPGARIALF